jgi:hypothetical protein
MRAEKFIFFCLISFFLLIYPLDCFSAQSPDQIKKELIKKGFSEEVLNILNPRAQERLNSKVPAGVVWYSTFDRDAKSITVDFQSEEKIYHNSVTVFSLANGGCLTVQNTIIMSTGPLKEEAERWIELYKKRGIKFKTEEESPERIYLSAEGKLGVKIYLYAIGKNLCLQVFRNVESIK